MRTALDHLAVIMDTVEADPSADICDLFPYVTDVPAMDEAVNYGILSIHRALASGAPDRAITSAVRHVLVLAVAMGHAIGTDRALELGHVGVTVPDTLADTDWLGDDGRD